MKLPEGNDSNDSEAIKIETLQRNPMGSDRMIPENRVEMFYS